MGKRGNHIKDELFRTHVFGGYRREDVDAYIERLEQEIIRLEAGLGPVEESAAPPDGLEDFIVLSGVSEDSRETAERGPEAAAEPGPAYEQLKEALAEEKGKRDQVTKLLQEALCERQRLEGEVEELRRDRQSYEEDRDAIKDVLINARIQAEVLLTKARKEARLLLEDAQEQASQQRQASLSQLIEDAHRQTGRRERETIAQLMGQLSENYSGLQASKYFLEEQVRSIEHMEKQIAELRDRMEGQLDLTEESSSHNEKEAEPVEGL